MLTTRADCGAARSQLRREHTGARRCRTAAARSGQRHRLDWRHRILAGRHIALAGWLGSEAAHSTEDTRHLRYGFTLDTRLGRANRLACYSSHAGKAQLERISERWVEVRVEKPFPKGRSRINCTLPGPSGRWYWLGNQFYVKR